MAEDVGNQQYYIVDFLLCRLIVSKSISDQTHDYRLLINNLKREEVELLEHFVTSCLIEKLLKLLKAYLNRILIN